MPLIILVLFISMPRIMSEIRYKCLLNKLVSEWLKVSLLRKSFTYLFIWLILCCPVTKHVWILQSLNSNLHIFSRESYLKSTEICTSFPHPSSYLSHLSALTTFSQFSSVVQSCLPLCDPMDCSMPGLPVHHQLPEFTHSCALSGWYHPTILSSDIPFSSCLQSFPASGSFQMSQLFASGSQSIGASASTSVLPMVTQDWFLFGWTGWISLLSKGLSRIFSNTTVQKHQLFSTQPSL